MLNLKKLSNGAVLAVIAVITMLLILLSSISIYYTNRMVSHYSTLVATSVEVKQETTIAHLWFEEIISGDNSRTIDVVWHHLDLSLRYIRDLKDFIQGSRALLKLAGNTEVIERIYNVESELLTFRNITSERYASEAFAGVGSEIEQKYDELFIGLMSDMDVVIAELKILSSNDLKRFNILQRVLILMILLSSAGIAIVLYLNQKRLLMLIDEQHENNLILSENKRRFQDIAFCGGDWVWEVDLQGRYTYASENVVDIIGYTSAEIIGKAPFDLMSEEEAERVAYIFSDIIKHEKKISDLDNWNTHKNGKLICLRTNGVPVYDDNGKLTGYRGVDKDVTDKVAMNNYLMRNQKMDALGKLTAGIAHDFNNMLGIILGYAEIIKSKVSDNEEISKYVSQIYNSGERARVLTDKLLMFSRKETSEARKTDINQLLRDDRKMLEKTLASHVRLQYELEVDLWPVWLDKSALGDAVLNMCLNAMQAIVDSGSIKIATRNVSLDADDAVQLNLNAGDYVVLTVSDTGEGMDDVTLQNIFDPFFTTKGKAAIGLGLSQVYGFVKRSDGEVHVSSKPGNGTQISIYLNRYISDAEDEPVIKVMDASWDLSGDETILVVDDEDALRGLAEEFLTTHGYKVLTAENGEQALAILAKEKIDLLFSDVIMPGMDGYELAARVIKDYPNIKIQLASGFSDMYQVRDFNERLNEMSLKKPYSSKALLQRIRLLLDAPAAS